MIREMPFKEYSDVALEQLNAGQILHAICHFTGMYDACLLAEISSAETIFSDLPEALLEHLEALKQEIIQTLSRIVISDYQAIAAIHAILGHYITTYKQDAGYLKYMEPVMLQMVDSSGTAKTIENYFEQNEIDDSLVPRLAVRIASFLDDPLIWREKVEDFMELDLDVALQLMDYYWDHDPECFRLVGRKVLHYRLKSAIPNFSRRFRKRPYIHTASLN